MTGSWLWLFGPPGVGKTVSGFRLFQRLAERGEHVAFVEIDQIGMCMPASTAERSAAKTDNLINLLANFHTAGAAVVVTGDVVETMHDLLERTATAPFLCRLRADDAVTLQRLTGRGGLEWAMPSQTYEAFDVPAGDVDITTHGSVDEVVDEILRGVGSWPPTPRAGGARDSPAPDHVAEGEVVLITGPRAVGTSTIGWQVFMQSLAARRTGFLDLDQLGWVAGVSHEERLAVTLANLSACWAGFQRQGAQRLVLCWHAGGHEALALGELFPSMNVVGLTATTDTLVTRARRRNRGLALPGEYLLGKSEDDLRSIVLASKDVEPGFADLIFETDRVTPDDLASKISSLWAANE